MDRLRDDVGAPGWRVPTADNYACFARSALEEALRLGWDSWEADAVIWTPPPSAHALASCVALDPSSILAKEQPGSHRTDLERCTVPIPRPHLAFNVLSLRT
jgi:hypothetical protein